MKYDRNEIVAGIFVLGCIFLFLAFIFKAGDFKESMQPKKEIVVRFSHARGIKTNSPIYYAGVQSGKVSNLSVDEKDNIYITLQLEKGINIRKDSIVKIGASVMGEAYIEITPGQGEIVETGETVMGNDSGIAQQIEDVVTSIQDLVKSDKITSSLDNLDKTLKNIAIVSETFANDKDKIEAIISNINEITQSLNEDLGEITEKMNTVLSNVAEMTDAEQVKKIDQITENMVGITENAENILVENRKSIKAVTTNIESITDNLYILSADLKRNPWKAIWKSKEQDVEKYALQDAIMRLKEAEKNLITLNENNEKISDEELEEIRALIQNLKTIQKSTQELTTQKESQTPKRKPFGR
ncbi:MAG: MCE family protein [Candidatus Omnitrophica bacterium]|nr:MCE family protein [Candidatus Omnitrophota bacterium]MBU1047146.1 MCE family protein [Candidatus Omnitrophota bacterium]MBU1889576.1 MCE family protein [Candidatus Omnitrophota bacterium]